MRILQLITTIDLGGAEKQLLTLTRGLKKSEQIIVMPLKGKLELQNSFEQNQINISTLLANRNVLVQIWLVRKFIKKERIDLVHAHLPQAEIVALGVPRRVPIVITRHNAEPYYKKIHPLFSVLLSKFVTRRASFVIAITDVVGRYLRKHAEVSKKKSIVTIHYGYDNLQSSVSRVKVSQPFKFLTIARLEKQKDIGTLLKAFAVLRKESFDSELTIIGKGSLESHLKKESKELKIEQKVHWVNSCYDIAHKLSLHHAFVLTSLYEGFGLVYLEAMVAGIPILTSRNEAAVEIFGDNYAGFFEIGDSKRLATLMDEVLRHDKFRQDLVSSYGDTLERFQIQQTVKYHLELYSLAQGEKLR